MYSIDVYVYLYMCIHTHTHIVYYRLVHGARQDSIIISETVVPCLSRLFLGGSSITLDIC